MGFQPEKKIHNEDDGTGWENRIVENRVAEQQIPERSTIKTEPSKPSHQNRVVKIESEKTKSYRPILKKTDSKVTKPKKTETKNL